VARDLSAPAIAGNSQGGFVVAWRKDQGGILARFYWPSGETEDRLPVLVSSRARNVTLTAAMDEAGSVLLAWDCCGDRSRIFGRFFAADGEPLSDEFRLSFGPGSDFEPAAAAAPDGDFLVVWRRGSPGQIMGRWLGGPDGI
jgi:hypothetical protein